MQQQLPPSTRPRGDITTVLDIASRDSQDGYLFPLDTKNSWFSRTPTHYNTSTLNIQDFVHKGTAEWGGRLTFELNALQVGDMLQGVAVQFRLGHWYSQQAVLNLLAGKWTVDTENYTPWTYVNGLGATIIEWAEFVIGDQTVERITGEFIKTYLSLNSSINSAFGYGTDGIGLINESSMSPNRPWPTESGQYISILPFFMFRSLYSETLPILSCAEGTIRINIQLRTFQQSVRIAQSPYSRASCDETPLNQTAIFLDTSNNQIRQPTASQPPPFTDFRLITFAHFISQPLRTAYIHRPVEQLNQFVQTFTFDEPLRYSVNKTNPNTDSVDISLPLELNHPVKELFWIFRRKATAINNEWLNFSPYIQSQQSPTRTREIPWLDYATLRVNGQILEQAEGDWWRTAFARKHTGGYLTYANNTYGYVFSRQPDEHQPSGYANMSKAHTIRLNLTVNTPQPVPSTIPLGGFDAGTNQGWEIFVYAIYYNWLRFENGLCQKVFSD